MTGRKDPVVRTSWAVPEEKQGILKKNDVFTKRGGYLSLLGSIDYNYFFAAPSVNVEKAEILTWTEAKYNEVDILTEENATVYTMTYVESSDRYEYKYAGLAAREMFSPIYACAKFTDTEGKVYYSGVVAYCPERFASMNANSSIAVDAELAKRIVIYGDAARSFFAKYN